MQQKMRDGTKLCSSLDDLDIIELDKLPDIFGGNAPLKDISGKGFKKEPCQKKKLKIYFIQESWAKKLTEMRPFFLKYNEMKINHQYYTPAVLNCEVKTLSHRLENPSAKLLTEY
jgi:hypothetical protein